MTRKEKDERKRLLMKTFQTIAKAFSRKPKSRDIARDRLMSVLQMDRAAVTMLSMDVNFDAMCTDLAAVVAQHLQMTPGDVRINYTQTGDRVLFEAGLKERAVSR